MYFKQCYISVSKVTWPWKTLCMGHSEHNFDLCLKLYKWSQLGCNLSQMKYTHVIPMISFVRLHMWKMQMLPFFWETNDQTKTNCILTGISSVSGVFLWLSVETHFFTPVKPYPLLWTDASICIELKVKHILWMWIFFYTLHFPAIQLVYGVLRTFL